MFLLPLDGECAPRGCTTCTPHVKIKATAKTLASYLPVQELLKMEARLLGRTAACEEDTNVKARFYGRAALSKACGHWCTGTHSQCCVCMAIESDLE